MTDAQAQRLWDRACSVREGGRIVEIGSFRGRSTIVLASAASSDAEVVAIDVEKVDDAEWPPRHRERLKADAEAFELELGRGFRLARGCLDSSARRVACSVLDLEPAVIGGPVDVASQG